ncbi:MAG: urease accessory protein UreD [Chloroflexota bacterium]|jgi:urease accessory protein
MNAEPLCGLQPSAFSLQPSLELLLERDAGGVTRPLRCLAQPPVQLSRVRYDDPARPDTACMTLLHLGGVLEGDRLEMRVRLGTGASGRVVMAAATQVLTMPAGDAAHALDIRLAAGSELLWQAEPLILFAGARFTQRTRVALAPGARLALLEVLVPGRLARGERYAFERYESRVAVHDAAGRLLMAERALLEPRRYALDAPGVLGANPVVGSLYLLGDTVDAEGLAARLYDDGDASLGASPLPGGCGLLVRALGDTPSTVRARLLMALRRASG